MMAIDPYTSDPNLAKLLIGEKREDLSLCFNVSKALLPHILEPRLPASETVVLLSKEANKENFCQEKHGIIPYFIKLAEKKGGKLDAKNR